METKRSVHSSPPLDHAVAVLAVGSEAGNVSCLRNICTGAGWTLHEARTLRAALARLEHDSIPVVICQHQLPDGDWTALLDATSGLPEPPCLIVWSHHADNSLWAEVLNLGGYDVLAAPFREEEVAHSVRMAATKWHGQISLAGRLRKLAPAV